LSEVAVPRSLLVVGLVAVLCGGALVALFVAVDRGLFLGAATPPPRPTGVPTDATWVGGVDGGWFVACRPAVPAATGRYTCAIYGDVAGELVTRGPYKLHGVGPTPIRASDYLSVTTEAIEIKGARKLLPDGVIDHPAAATSETYVDGVLREGAK
jgi:hypothetical protein